MAEILLPGQHRIIVRAVQHFIETLRHLPLASHVRGFRIEMQGVAVWVRCSATAALKDRKNRTETSMRRQPQKEWREVAGSTASKKPSKVE